MNDWSKHAPDLVVSAAPVNGAAPNSTERWMSEGVAAIWRRRLRSYRTLPLHPDDAVEHASEVLVTDSATISERHAIVRDFAVSQQAGLAAIIRLAGVAAPDRPSTAARPLPPRPEPSTSPNVSAAYSPPARPVPVTAPATTALDWSALPAPPILVAAGGSPDSREETDRRQRTIRTSPRFAHVPGLCLIGILTIQAVLSLRLVWNNTAYIDEATYLWAGHLEIAHWLHDTPIPPFQTWFSGAPVVYPPIAALADHIGGLVGARILSLAFMIAATALLCSSAKPTTTLPKSSSSR